jgi:hypothetical protein
MKRKLYVELASRVDARKRCAETGNTLWYEKHEEKIAELIDTLPHGSGIDGKTELDFDASRADKLVITGEYHAMNEVGYYDGWYDFKLTVTPSLVHGFTMSISGRFGKYQDVKEYLYEVFRDGLLQEVD